MFEGRSIIKDIIMLPKLAWVRHGILILFLFFNLFYFDGKDIVYIIREYEGIEKSIASDLLARARLYSFYNFFVAICLVYINHFVLVK
jgi:hypothetical protein